MSSLLRSSKFVRLFASATRNLVTSTRFNVEIRQSQALATPSLSYLRTFASAAASTSSNYTSSVEKSLHQIDQDVRRMGRVSRKELEEVLEEIKQSRNATSSQSLLLIRCCGSLVPDELPEVRTKLVQEIWATLEKLKIPMDISHYNALLRVYLENEHKFSPAEFLQNLEKKGVEPNRVTYQRLITRYCQDGDIEGATRILEFMREKSLPVNENVFNALIMGHAQSDDMESAAGILSVMKQAGLDPSADTYTTLLVGHAKKGDIGEIRKILAECDQKEISLTDKDHLELIFALSVNGHSPLADEIIPRIRKSAGFTQDAISFIMRLVNHGQEEVAMKIWQIMPRLQRDENENIATRQGNFLIRQMVKAHRPIESILKVCKIIENEGLNNKALFVATEASLLQGDVESALKFFNALQESGAQLRQHYFWPLFCSAGQTKNDQLVQEILQNMGQKFGLVPTGETIRDYVLPNLTLSNPDQIIGFLKRSGVSSGGAATALVVDFLQNNAIADAASVASKYRAFYIPALLRRPLTLAYLKTGATEHYLNIIHHVYEGMDRNMAADESENTSLERRDVVGYFLTALLQFAKDRPVNLDAILKGLLDRGLGLTTTAAEQIQSRLSGEQLTNEISELLTKLTADDLEPVAAQRTRIPLSAFSGQNEENLLQRIARGEEAGQTMGIAKRNLLVVYSKNQQVDKALEVFQSMGDDAGPGAFAYIIEALAAAGRLDEALSYLEKFRNVHKDSALNPLKIARLVNALFSAGRVDEGVQLLSDCPSADNFDDTPFVLKSSVFQLLNTLAEKGDIDNLDKAFEIMVKKNFVEVSNVILGPLIKGRILKNDIDGAMKKFEECVENYKMTPWKNELAKKLIESEDAVSLQRITDASSKVHGEINSLYDLVFAFVECGRIRQARKILETPGLRSRSQRFNMICERYQQEGTVSALEGLLEATKDMSHIDRTDIFQHLLTTHIKNDNAEKALGVWTQMQEEDVHPSDAFLVELANYLESKNLGVPFVKPNSEPVVKKPEKTKVSRATDGSSPALISFKNALRSGQWERAKIIRNELVAKNVSIPANDLSSLLEGFCQSNQLNEAANLAVDMLSNNARIIPRHFKFLVTKMAQAGDVDKIIKIGDKIDSGMKKIVSFDNKLCAAFIASGRAAEYMDQLLEEARSAKPENVDELLVKFPRGAISSVIEAHPELLPKFEQIVEIYGKLGAKSPATALWSTFFLQPEWAEREQKVWDAYNLADEPRLMFQRIVSRARNARDYPLIKRLLDRVKGTKISEPALGIVYSCAIDILVSSGKNDEALEQLNQALKDVSLENLNTTCLQRLQQGLTATGKTFPYTIPTKSSENPEDALFCQIIGFDSSALIKPNLKDWRHFVKDDSGILSLSISNPYHLPGLDAVKRNAKSSSSSSSDDETEEQPRK